MGVAALRRGIPVTRRAVKHAVLRREIIPTRLGNTNLYSKQDGWDFIASRKQSGVYRLSKPLQPNETCPGSDGNEPGQCEPTWAKDLTEMIRETTTGGKPRRNTNGHRRVNYRELAPVYLRRGYLAPIPLPHGRKSPPPNGFTGHHNTQPPMREQIDEWRETRGDDGIAFVLQDGQIVIDVDNYAKGEWPAGTGAATMADLALRAACDLPRVPNCATELTAARSGHSACRLG